MNTSTLFCTERLHIRKFYPEDYNDLTEILTDKEVTYFEPCETFTKEQCIQEAINFSQSDDFFAVVLENKVIGKIYFSKRSYESYEIGYTFNIKYQGKGYAFESVKGMLNYAFNTLNIRRIFAEINTRNEKSIKLIERLAMRKEATLLEYVPTKENSKIYDGMYIYALLQKEYK